MTTNMTTQPMTEDQIEIWAESMQDRLDRAYMTTNMRTAQYNHESLGSRCGWNKRTNIGAEPWN